MNHCLRPIYLNKPLFLSIALFFVLSIGILPNSALAKKLPSQYPRLANYYLDPEITKEEAKKLAKWDLVIIGIEHQYTNPEIFNLMREINDDIIIIAYIPSEEATEKFIDYTDPNYPQTKLYSELKNHEDWYLKNTSGEYLYFWPGQRLINVNSEWKNYLPQWMHDNVTAANPDKWDGIYYDNCFSDISWVADNIDMNQDGVPENYKDIDAAWQSGMNTMLKKSRELEGDDKFIVCNSAGEYFTYINGRLIEAFPSEYDGGWEGAMEKYYKVLKEGRNPSIVVVNSVASDGDQDNYREMRYNLASTLLGNGFASYDKSQGEHSQTWWYDEYDVVLGEPATVAYNLLNSKDPTNLENGVWRRDFDKGLVLLNSTNKEQRVILETGFEKIKGDQDPETNNGQVIGSVKIPAHDGLLLLGRLAQITNVSYVNGGYAKVFNNKGDLMRNSFFSYNDKFPGRTQIVRLPTKNKTIVAGDTYVEIYKGDKLIARFAPYGEGFTGGVNIAVGKLYKKDKRYYIVTGTRTAGPQVRIFGLNGKLKNVGCFPYAKEFRGGVNVGVGNLRGDSNLEIVVAAGFGGGPHVRVLDNKCKLIDTGFFAYDKSARYGVNIGIGDANNDGKTEIVTGPGPGGPPLIRIYSRSGKLLNKGFYAYDKNDTSGVLVGVADIDGNGSNEIVTSSFGIYNY